MTEIGTFRMNKIKSGSHLCRAEKHNKRDRDAIQPNHDPDRIKDNITHVRTDNISAKWQKIVGDNRGRKVRTDAVRAIELTFVFSPSAASRIDPASWGEKCLAWAQAKFGAENILSAHTHVDETTPHTQILLVPIDKKTGRLSAKSYVNGRDSLVHMQTDFARSVGSQFGLQRGKEGSTAKHVANQEYFQQVREASKNAYTEEIPPKPLLEKAESHAMKANATLKREIDKRVRAEVALENAQLHAIAAQSNATARKKTLKKDQNDLNRELREIRQMPLDMVMRACGYAEPDKREGSEWIYATEKGKVSINIDKQVYSVDWEKGGRGAIDLACEVQSLKVPQAIQWLKALDPTLGIGSAVQHFKRDAAKLHPVEKTDRDKHQIRPDPSKLDDVRNYLAFRQIDPKITEALIKTKRIWANASGSCVFPHRDADNKVVGATIRGTKSDFKACVGSKQKGFWSFKIGKNADHSKPTSFESPIDALSAATSGIKGLMVSCAGVSLPKLLKELYSSFIIAFDDDPAGNKAADKIIGEFPDSTRLKTEAEDAKDWNEAIKPSKGQEPSI